jgi:hypothetical protein
LRREAQPECAVRERPDTRSVDAFAYPLDQSSANQTLDQTEHGGLAQARSLHEFHQAERLTLMTERLQDTTSSKHRIGISPVPFDFHGLFRMAA